MKIVKLQDLPQSVSSHGDFEKKVMIGDGEIPHIHTFTQAILQPGQSAIIHKHQDLYEVFFVKEGKAKVIINKKKEYSIEKDSCFIIEPHEIHEVTNPFKKPLVLLFFRSKIL